MTLNFDLGSHLPSQSISKGELASYFLPSIHSHTQFLSCLQFSLHLSFINTDHVSVRNFALKIPIQTEAIVRKEKQSTAFFLIVLVIMFVVILVKRASVKDVKMTYFLE